MLPAHEYRFADLDSRLDGLIEHHGERLAEIAGRPQARRGPVRLGDRVAGDLVPAVERDHRLPARQAAIREVVSHLQYLAAAGQATLADVDGVGRWSLA